MQVTIPKGKGREIMHDGRWYPYGKPLEVDFSQALRMQRALGAELGYEPHRYDPSLWRDRRVATMVADVDTTSGWGNVGLNLLKHSPGVNFSLIGRLNGVGEPSVLGAARRSVEPGSAAVWHEQPKAEWLLTPFGRNLAIVPFETTRVPGSWVPRLNHMAAVMVPCAQNVEMMRDSGVTSPLELVHWGVDTKKFHPVERRAGRPFTFGTMGALSIRKGTDILVKAFQAAFPVEQDVRLICKTSNKGYPFMVRNEKRIEVQMGPVPHAELMGDFFAQIDCFVYPTRGEGFGLTIPEAMATGVPAIATGWSGPMEYMNDEVGWTIDYTLDKATEFDENVYHEDCGEWATPSLDHLVYLMRHAYENRGETEAKGRAAALHIQEKWRWEDQIGLFHDALDRHL